MTKSKSVLLLLSALVALAVPAATAAARDRDRDNLPDRWEKRYKLSTSKASGTADPDRDRLTNKGEYMVKTNPRKRDTDGDGAADGREVRLGSNPRNRRSRPSNVTARAAATNAAFSYSPSSPETGQAVTFDAGASTCDDNPCTYRWQDDGPDGWGGAQWTLGTGETLRFTFRQVGVKRVRLTVTDDDGVSDSTMRNVSVAAPDDDPGPAPSPSPSPAPSPSPPPAPAPSPSGGFPTPSSAGVPAGWTPDTTRSTNLTVNTAGTIIEDVRFSNGADLVINAPNVTVRRVHLQGGWIDAEGGGTVIEDSTIDPPQQGQGGEGVVSYCGYTARRVKIWNRTEGFRVGGRCGPVTIEDSFVRIVPPSPCGDWHGDGLQGYGGMPLTVRNLTVDFNETGGCGGTAPFFVPDTNTSANVDRLLVKGGGYSFRLGVPGSVRGLRIVDDSWGYGPIAVECALVSGWEASIVEIDANYQVTRTVRSQPCNTARA